MGLDYMVPYLGLRTHELLYEEIVNIIGELLSAWKKAKCYKDSFFTLTKILILGVSYIYI